MTLLLFLDPTDVILFTLTLLNIVGLFISIAGHVKFCLLRFIKNLELVTGVNSEFSGSVVVAVSAKSENHKRHYSCIGSKFQGNTFIGSALAAPNITQKKRSI